MQACGLCVAKTAAVSRLIKTQVSLQEPDTKNASKMLFHMCWRTTCRVPVRLTCTATISALRGLTLLFPEYPEPVERLSSLPNVPRWPSRESTFMGRSRRLGSLAVCGGKVEQRHLGSE